MGAATVSRYGLEFPTSYRWGVVTLGHTRMRNNPGTQAWSHLDPGISTQWIGPTGGELNVAINFADSAGIPSTHLTALVNGDPLDGLVRRGFGAMRVDTSFAKLVPYAPRGPVYGIVFSPLGFGEDSPEVTYHLAGEAAALLKPGAFDYDAVFQGGAVYAHSGGIFSTVSRDAPDLVIEFFREAGKRGVIRSFDLNYRERLWAHIGGKARAQEVCREIAANVEILEGNKSDLQNALNINAPATESASQGKKDPMDPAPHMAMIEATVKQFPNIRVVLTNLRHEVDASHQLWSVLAWINGKFYHAAVKELFVLDRVGGGDATTSYLLRAMLLGKSEQDAVDQAWAAGALCTATAGDTLKVGPDKIEAKARAGRSGAAAEIVR